MAPRQILMLLVATGPMLVGAPAAAVVLLLAVQARPLLQRTPARVPAAYVVRSMLRTRP
jgi:hypothetical protein